MKKITFKNLLFLSLCVFTLQTFAQVGFQEKVSYRLRTALPSPDDYNTSKTAPFAGQYVYPTVTAGSDALKVLLKDTNNPETQLFQFSPLEGQTVEFPLGTGQMHQVYNIVSSTPGNGTNGTGVLELNSLPSNGQRIRLRGNAYPFNDDLGKFIIRAVSGTATVSYYNIVAVATIGIDSGADRVVGPDTNYEWLNFGGIGGDVRPQFEDWVFETATGDIVLSNNEFETSSISMTNPVNNNLSITGLNGNVKQISMYSILGQQVLTRKLENADSAIHINVSALKRGVYLVTINGENSSFTRKIIKE